MSVGGAQRRRGSAPQALGVSSPWGLGHGAERGRWACLGPTLPGLPTRGSGALAQQPGRGGFLSKLH